MKYCQFAEPINNFKFFFNKSENLAYSAFLGLQVCLKMLFAGIVLVEHVHVVLVIQS